MKIDDKIYQYNAIERITQRQNNTTEKIQAPDNESTRVVSTDKSEQDAVVEISQNSKEAHMIRKIIEAGADIREDKVNSIKEHIEAGKYEIDHQKVASKLVDTFLEETF
jgi:flagellar biosynthesis anti-sigma factor FlgM